jgi:hypothetical protein
LKEMLAEHSVPNCALRDQFVQLEHLLNERRRIRRGGEVLRCPSRSTSKSQGPASRSHRKRCDAGNLGRRMHSGSSWQRARANCRAKRQRETPAATIGAPAEDSPWRR